MEKANFSDTHDTVVYINDGGYQIYSRKGGRYPYGVAKNYRTFDMAMTMEGAKNAIRDAKNGGYSWLR